MVESVGNEIMVSTEPEPLLRGSGNEVAAIGGEVLVNELVVPSTEGEDNLETFREVHQSSKVEFMRVDAMVSDKPAEAGKVCMEDELKDRSEAIQVNSVHAQDKNVTVSKSVSSRPSTIEASDVQDLKDNTAAKETSAHADIGPVDFQTSNGIERNGKIVTGLCGVDAANFPDDSKLTDGVVTRGEILKAASTVDTIVDAELSAGEHGSVQVAPAASVSETMGIADTSFAVEVLEEVDDGCISLCDDEFDELGLEKNKGSAEHIPSHAGISVKFQEQDWQDNSEAAEPIRSYVPSGVKVQKHVIVDSVLHDGEEGPVSDESLSEGSGDPAGINIYGQENMDKELLDDVWESPNQEEPGYGASVSKHEDNAGCSSSRSGALVRRCRATYDLPPLDSDELSVSDLVWGKVKSHPWWPGQIFHQSDSSEKAMKYYKKDCYLVAYFGDRSFAWNDVSQLRPFKKHFSQEEKQSNAESFQNAINCALEEVHRRIEVELACSCLPQDVYEKVRFQTVQNAGISKVASRREGGDGSTSLDSFQPDKLVRFVRRLAQLPSSGANRLELATAKAHLSSFYRLKGHYPLPEFQFHGGLLEDDVDSSSPQENKTEKADSVAEDGISGAGRTKGALKRKHNLKDIVYHRRKEKSFSEIMGDSMFNYDIGYESDEKLNDMASPTPGRKRKANFVANDFTVQETPRTISLAKVSKTVNSSPRQSFKIGDCIRRVASQLTGAPSSSAGSPSTLKAISDVDDKPPHSENGSNSVQTVEETKTDETKTEKVVDVAEESSPDQLLLQLQLTSCSPSKVHGFSRPMIGFFSEFRDSVASVRHSDNENSSSKKSGAGRKRKSALASAVGLSEAFEFEEKGDSYWTDMVVQHDSTEKPERRGRKRKNQQQQDVTDQQEKPVKVKRKYTKKQHAQGNNDEVPSAEKYSEPTKLKEQLDTELILTFTGTARLPSEANLNKMLKRFGPLKESETRVDQESNHARVIFKKGSDAEVAYSSVAAFGIFGPSSAVTYKLNYAPSLQSESQPPPPLALPNQSEGAS